MANLSVDLDNDQRQLKKAKKIIADLITLNKTVIGSQKAMDEEVKTPKFTDALNTAVDCEKEDLKQNTTLLESIKALDKELKRYGEDL